MDQTSSLRLAEKVFRHPCIGLSQATAFKIWSESNNGCWFALIPMSKLCMVSRAALDRFVRHYYKLGLLERKGFGNTGYRYRWIGLDNP